MTSAAPAKTSTLAIVALVLSLGCGPVGSIVGAVALARINKSNGELGGKGLAIASVVIGVIGWVFLGILAGIAIPNFMRYKLRSQQSEARTMLSSIRVGQESFRMEHDAYLTLAPVGGGSGSQPVAWDAAPCEEACGRDNLAACTSFDCIGVAPYGPSRFTYACNAVGDDYACAAVGDLDDDGEVSVWIVGSNNSGGDRIAAPLPAIAVEAGCVNGATHPAKDVVNCTLTVY